jgi:hypothetical protein
MLRTILGGAALVTVLSSASGCGTVSNLMLQTAYGSEPTIFGGIEFDTGLMADGASGLMADGASRFQTIHDALDFVGAVDEAAFGLVDLPFSAVADVLAYPFALWAYDPKQVKHPCTSYRNSKPDAADKQSEDDECGQRPSEPAASPGGPQPLPCTTDGFAHFSAPKSK